MANTEPARAIQVSLGDRINGLNHVATLRGKHFPPKSEKDMCRFIDDMRDRFEPGYHDNLRVLSVILDLADIDKERQHLKFSELTTDEKERLIKAMNKLKAVVSLFPRNLILPK